jgi:hypothetical protein
MALNLVSKSKLFIQSALAGNVYLRNCKAPSETDDSDVELAYGPGEENAIGYIRKPTGGSIEIEEYRLEGAAPLVDWHKLKAAAEKFVLNKRDTNGQGLQYGGCIVASVSDDDDAEGGHTRKIKIVWATRETL